MNIWSRIIPVVVAGVLATAVSSQAAPHTAKGFIRAITVNDLSNQRGMMNSDERFYIVSVKLDSEPKRLFGLAPRADGRLSDTQDMMAKLLREAFLAELEVTIRWESPVKSRARILSVTASRK